MRRYGTDYPYLIDNPADGVWLVRFDIQPNHGEYGALAYGTNYEEAVFSHKPSLQEVRDTISAYYDRITEQEIREGYSWDGVPVRLSDTERQELAENFMLSAVSQGANLPYAVKGGTEENPVYFNLATTEEMERFYTGLIHHVKEARQKGWVKNGEIDYVLYDNYLNSFEDMTDLEKAKMEQSNKVLRAMDSRRHCTLDGKEVWQSPYERRLLYEKLRRGNDIWLGETSLTAEVARKVLDTMADYADCISSVQQEKQERIRLAQSPMEVQKIDPEEGYPEILCLETAVIQSEIETEAAESPEVQAVLFARQVINSVPMTASQALERKVLFPIWGEENAEFGKAVEAGFKLRYRDTLYEVAQEHKLAPEWVPGIDTLSLYKPVEMEHAGTADDPIPWTKGMELLVEKYYTDKEVLYRCLRDSGQAMAFDLAELVAGGYVEVITDKEKEETV